MEIFKIQEIFRKILKIICLKFLRVTKRDKHSNKYFKVFI